MWAIRVPAAPSQAEIPEASWSGEQMAGADDGALVAVAATEVLGAGEVRLAVGDGLAWVAPQAATRRLVAASAANAAIAHVRNWIGGTPEGDWVSMGLPADGSYGIAEGVMYGYPAVCRNGRYEIVKGIDVSDFSRARMQVTLKELHEERDSIKHLLG